MRLITSIPRRIVRTDAYGVDIGEAYVSKCIESWRLNGFTPVSLNRREELTEVKNKFDIPSASFADSYRSIYKGKFGPSFGVMLKRQNYAQSLCIINADICMLKYKGLAHRIDIATQDYFLFARRIDVQSSDYSCPAIYTDGVDFVAFRPDRILNVIHDTGIKKLKLGIFWWDYVLPIAASFFMPVRRIGDPLFLHYYHEPAWDADRYKHLRQVAFDILRRLANSQRNVNIDAAIFASLIEGLDIDSNKGGRVLHEVCSDWLEGRIGPIKEISLGVALQQPDIGQLVRASVGFSTNLLLKQKKQEQELKVIYNELEKRLRAIVKLKERLLERKNTVRSLRQRVRDLEKQNKLQAKSIAKFGLHPAKNEPTCAVNGLVPFKPFRGGRIFRSFNRFQRWLSKCAEIF